MNERPTSFYDRLVTHALKGGVPFSILVFSLLIGVIALNFTPREEEPQIVVPVIDVQSKRSRYVRQAS